MTDRDQRWEDSGNGTLKRGQRVVGPVRVLLLAAILTSGCVGELLAPEPVTTRTVACAFLDPAMGVRVVHHVTGEVPDQVLQAASASWVAAVTEVVERDLELMSWAVREGPDDEVEAWRRSQEVLLDDRLDLHVLWLRQGALRAVDVLAPGFVVINATAWRLGAAVGDGEGLARGLLFHGLGHALGVVNRGVPLHDADGPRREQPMHHEPGGVMSAEWHQLSTFPANMTARAYPEAVADDWRHAATEVCP